MPPKRTNPAEQTTPVHDQKPDDGKVESAMARFVDALARRNTEDFLKCFSQKIPFTYIFTLEKPYQKRSVRYAQLAKDLAGKDTDLGWYSTFFDAGPDDSFSRFAENLNGRPWKRVCKDKFVPPDDSANSAVFVIWRKERGTWRVDTVGDPTE